MPSWTERLKRWDYLRQRAYRFDLLLIVALLCLRSSAFGSYYVPSGSMRPTISVGERFLANKLAYGLRLPGVDGYVWRWAEPQCGDIVVFQQPQKKVDFVKRVVGVPGDRIRIEGNQVWRNGRPAALTPAGTEAGALIFTEDLAGRTHQVRLDPNRPLCPRLPELTVPAGQLFVLGDSRDTSWDSRFWGFVPLDAVAGKLVWRWYSPGDNLLWPEWRKIGTIQ